MARPKLAWSGRIDGGRGEARWSVGTLAATVALPTYAEALSLQQVLDAAYNEGARDALGCIGAAVALALDETTTRGRA